MGENEIRKYAGLMRELGLTGLEITENDRVVRLERTPPARTAQASLTEPAGSVKPEPETDPDALVVRSPRERGSLRVRGGPGEKGTGPLHH